MSSLEDESKNNKQNVKDYVQKAVEEQAQESKGEQLEKEKRQTSIIVHGLRNLGLMTAVRELRKTVALWRPCSKQWDVLK